MADSDDEYDRKRRDKFRGERTEAYSRGEGRRGGPAEGDGRRREEWMERDYARGSRYPARGGAYRDYRGGGGGGGGRDAYSSAMSRDVAPAAKRMRGDWGDDRRPGGYGYEAASGDASYNGGYQQRASYAPHHAASYGSGPAYKMTPGGRSSGADPGGSGGGGGDTQPPVMSFKAFLITQDDSITDEQALKKYNEYKLEFRRQQLNEFFVEHKEEEWFKIKYHPEDSVKRKAEQAEALANRVKVFMEFLESGRTDKVSVDADKSEELIRLLDAVVIRLEGGTDADLQALDNNTSLQDNVGAPPLAPATDKGADGARPSAKAEIKQEEADNKPFILGGDDEPAAKQPPPAATRDPSEPLLLQISSEQVELQKKAAEFSKQNSAEDEDAAAAPAAAAVPDIELPPPGAAKRKRSYSESGSDSGEDPASPGKEDNEGADTDEPPPPGLEEEAELPKDIAEVDKKSEDGEESEDKIEEDLNNGAEDISDKEDTDKALSIAEDGEEGGENGGGSATPPPPSRPRCLHRTASIFLRNLAATITKQEVETMCRRFPGYLRVAIADPQPERRWFRRGWVTFERHVNIKDICWNLSNNRLRDHDLGAVVNRDLPQRVRTVNGITSHRTVVRNDIKLSARMVHNLDAKAGLWDQHAEADAKRKKKKRDEDLPSFNLSSKNPVLKNITDYLIEEASAEEDELLGLTPEAEDAKAEDGAAMCRDEELIRVLDRLLMYLRVVHSVDYYNHCEYPNEDEMPNRCGIVHARGIAPSLKISHEELSDYCQTFEGKIASFLQPLAKLSTEEYNKLGPKDPDTEVEKFVKANSQELSTDKWFCPLSGKKFKGPDFVRKHIFNKYAEKVDEVKREVEYYNNYLKDPKRPLLAEHPGSRQRAEGEGTSAPAAQPYFHHQYGGNNSYGGGYGGGGRSYGAGYQNYARPRGGGGYPRGRGGASGESRPVIHYRDLDAAREPEEFV